MNGSYRRVIVNCIPLPLPGEGGCIRYPGSSPLPCPPHQGEEALVRCLLLGLAFYAFVPQVPASPVTTLDDIKFWVGTGPNRAAIAIDWDGDNLQPGAEALVWGYRWEGAASGETMLRAVLAADDRLYAKLSAGGALGVAAYGVGHDADNDHYFALEDGTAFDADGIAITPPSDGVLALDPDDRYEEGWLFGYWHFAATTGPDPTGWASSVLGASGTVLTHGSWHSYAFSPSLSTTAFADNLVAAAPPELPGDYNADGAVDAADYTVWRDTQMSPEAYDVWTEHYGAGTPSNTSSIPEPTSYSCLLTLIASHFLMRFFQPRVNS